MRVAVRLTVLLLAITVAAGCEVIPAQQRAVDHYVQSQLLIAQGDLDAALAELAKAVEADPELSIAHATAGNIHRRRGNCEMARRCYELACETNPYAFSPHYNLGVTYQMLAGAAEAVERIQQYLRQAVRVYLRALTIQPDDFEANLNLSACYFQLVKYELAEKYCLDAVRINPRSPEAYSNLGIIYNAQDRLYEAVRAYKASLELDTHQPKLLLNLGATYMRQGRPKAALRVSQLAAEEAPADPGAWEQIGACHVYLRDYAKAMEAYEKAAALDAGSATAYRGIGVVCMSQYVLDRSKIDLLDKALEAWNASLEIQSDQEDLRRLVQKYTPKYTAPEL